MSQTNTTSGSHWAICSQENGNTLGQWNCDSKVLVDIQGRVATGVATLEDAKKIMREQWSWVLTAADRLPR